MSKYKRNISGFFDFLEDVAWYCEECDDFHFASESEDAIPVVDKFYIKEVIYNDPATIIVWSDGTKTIAKAHDGDVYSKEAGFTMCVLKKLVGNATFRNMMEDWVTEGSKVTIKNVRQSLKK